MTTTQHRRGPGHTDPAVWKPCSHRGCCFRFRSDAARVWCAYHADQLSAEYQPYTLRSKPSSARKTRHAVEVGALLTETFGEHSVGGR
ncbi:MAG: hypothetical protein ACRDRR_03025 [Pseudonocardiaceae bacterium]